jgi:hypothetical protein
MSLFETAVICSAEEYESKRSSRQSFSEINSDYLGMLMVRLDSQEKEAAKLPVKISDITKGVNVTSKCSLDFLNDRLETIFSREYWVRDDLVVVGGFLTVKYDEVTYSTVEAYVKDYFEEMMPPAFRADTALSLV